MEFPRDEWSDGSIDDEGNQFVRRVIASRSLAGEDVGPNDDCAAIDAQLVFEQSGG
jgi:hypothetical protein